MHELPKTTPPCAHAPHFAIFNYLNLSLVDQLLQNTEKCKRVIIPGRNTPVTTNALHFKECKRNDTCLQAGNHVGPMCACNDGFRLNKTTGECVPNEKCPDLEPVKELKLGL